MVVAFVQLFFALRFNTNKRVKFRSANVLMSNCILLQVYILWYATRVLVVVAYWYCCDVIELEMAWTNTQITNNRENEEWAHGEWEQLFESLILLNLDIIRMCVDIDGSLMFGLSRIQLLRKQVRTRNQLRMRACELTYLTRAVRVRIFLIIMRREISVLTCVYISQSTIRAPMRIHCNRIIYVCICCQGALRHFDTTLGQEMLEVVGWLRDIQARDGDVDCRENARKLLTIMWYFDSKF